MMTGTTMTACHLVKAMMKTRGDSTPGHVPRHAHLIVAVKNVVTTVAAGHAENACRMNPARAASVNRTVCRTVTGSNAGLMVVVISVVHVLPTMTA